MEKQTSPVEFVEIQDGAGHVQTTLGFETTKLAECRHGGSYTDTRCVSEVSTDIRTVQAA